MNAEGRIFALDAKINLEDDALARHPELRELRDTNQEDPLEAQAQEHQISYVKLDGDVACLVNGAGLAMATMDVVRTAGGRPANFLDVGGGASEEKVAQALGIMLSDPQVKSVLVNIFGGILHLRPSGKGHSARLPQRRRRPPIVGAYVGHQRGRGTGDTQGVGTST